VPFLKKGTRRAKNNINQRRAFKTAEKVGDRGEASLRKEGNLGNMLNGTKRDMRGKKNGDEDPHLRMGRRRSS